MSFATLFGLRPDDFGVEMTFTVHSEGKLWPFSTISDALQFSKEQLEAGHPVHVFPVPN